MTTSNKVWTRKKVWFHYLHAPNSRIEKFTTAAPPPTTATISKTKERKKFGVTLKYPLSYSTEKKKWRKYLFVCCRFLFSLFFPISNVQFMKNARRNAQIYSIVCLCVYEKVRRETQRANMLKAIFNVHKFSYYVPVFNMLNLYLFRKNGCGCVRAFVYHIYIYLLSVSRSWHAHFSLNVCSVYIYIFYCWLS